MFLSKTLILSYMITHHIMEQKHFCRHRFQTFSTEEILKCHIKDCSKIKGIQRIIMPKKVNMVNSKNMKENQAKNIIYADFESILVREDNGKEIPKESYIQTNIKNVLLAVTTIN